ncbi:MAG: hypothetical protein R3Y43_07400 [Alphaproteobacteria bacterium]
MANDIKTKDQNVEACKVSQDFGAQEGSSVPEVCKKCTVPKDWGLCPDCMYGMMDYNHLIT